MICFISYFLTSILAYKAGLRCANSLGVVCFECIVMLSSPSEASLLEIKLGLICPFRQSDDTVRETILSLATSLLAA